VRVYGLLIKAVVPRSGVLYFVELLVTSPTVHHLLPLRQKMA
jgi:hypothetical protein